MLKGGYITFDFEGFDIPSGYESRKFFKEGVFNTFKKYLELKKPVMICNYILDGREYTHGATFVNISTDTDDSIYLTFVDATIKYEAITIDINNDDKINISND